MDHLLSMEKESLRNKAYEKHEKKLAEKKLEEVGWKFLFSFERLGD